MSTVLKNTRLTLEMIKIEHTLFALPFAFLGAVLAANGLPSGSAGFVDRGGDGRRAIRGNGIQSHRRSTF